MSKQKNSSKLPKMCRDRNQCFSWHNGKRVYHGKWGTPEANRNYSQFLQDLTQGSGALPENGKNCPPVQGNVTGNTLVAELCSAFLQERREKVSPTQWDNERQVIAVLVSLYGDKETATFDINCLRTVRHEFIRKRYVRRKINWRVQIVKSIFRWGASFKIYLTRLGIGRFRRTEIRGS